ncbi:RICIN domain-containing protein [Rhodococcus marinonascens]|uniref:RICIN domain-containing protein n=1 Tax=Rhodococcus marinonascens TaxID=38311 RepID=UPI001114C093|nr:RICIN domain-containing protein [Rhodococcus marinonascens]
MAPETVTRGQEFTYRIQPDPITTHKILDDGSLVLWRNIRYDVDIPPGTEFVSAKVASDPTTPFQNTPTITRIDPNGKKDDNGSILRMDINEEGRPSDLNSDEALAFEGGHSNGWATQKNPGFLTFPGIDVTITAGNAGQVIEPTLRVSTSSDPDANTFGSADNFFRVIAVSHNNAGDSDTIVYCAPLDPPPSSVVGAVLNPDVLLPTVNAGGMPLTSIKVLDSPIFGLNGRVLEPVDIPGSSTPHIQMKDFVSGDKAQQWFYTSDHEFRNPATNKCIDVVEDGFDAGGQRNGSQVVLNPCHGNPGQKWTLDPAVTEDGNPGGAIINQADGKCMDVTDNVSADGVQVQIWDCTGAPNQQWNFPPAQIAGLN